MACLGFTALQYSPGYRDESNVFHATTNTLYFDDDEVSSITPDSYDPATGKRELVKAGFPWWMILVLGGVYLSSRG